MLEITQRATYWTRKIKMTITNSLILWSSGDRCKGNAIRWVIKISNTSFLTPEFGQQPSAHRPLKVMNLRKLANHAITVMQPPASYFLLEKQSSRSNQGRPLGEMNIQPGVIVHTKQAMISPWEKSTRCPSLERTSLVGEVRNFLVEIYKGFSARRYCSWGTGQPAFPFESSTNLVTSRFEELESSKNPSSCRTRLKVSNMIERT